MWDSSFSILGVTVDNRLKKLNENFENIFQRVNGLINKWKCYGLTIPGRELITKSILLSQYTYLGSMLDMTDSQLEKIQNQLNHFVLENTDSTDVNEKSNNWIKADLLYAPADKGGRNLINVRHYFKGLKLSQYYEPNCHFFTVKGLIHHVEGQADAHTSGGLNH